MAAYVVFIRESTRDRSELEAYTPKAQASLAGHPIKVLAAYGRHQVLGDHRLKTPFSWNSPPSRKRRRGTTARRISRRASTASGAPTIAPSSSKGCDAK